MPNTHKVDLIGQEVVAEHLGITSQAISNWYKREAEAIKNGGTPWGFPVATLIQFTPGKKPLKAWRRAQLSVWQKWFDKHMAERGKNIPRTRKAKDDDRTDTGGEAATEGASQAEALRDADESAQGGAGIADRELSGISV